MPTWSKKYRTLKEDASMKRPFQASPEYGEATGNLEETIERIEEIIGVDGDLVVRRLMIDQRFPAALLFLSSITDQSRIQEDVLKPFMLWKYQDEEPPKDGEDSDLLDRLWKESIYVSQGKRSSDISEMLQLLAFGNVLLIADQIRDGLAFNLRQIERRGIEQPQTEQVIRGAREGFIEQLETNLSLIRYRLQTPDLKIETAQIGERTKTPVAVCFVEGICDPEIIKDVTKRLARIDFDGIIDPGYIEQFIEDHPLSPFPQIQNTERPDKTVSALLAGRVVILTEGSSFALIVPATFDQFFQTIDDYSERFFIGTLIRQIRIIALLFSLFFPALYVAVISFNPELLPTAFAVAISGGRAGVPFPAVLEVLLMEVAMEILREATIRLPQMIGGALSIVGVLVVGQAAVSAGLASPITVVIVALTTIGSFATPAYDMAIALRMLRFPLIILAGLFGLFGIILGTIVIINHLLALESFGIPYMSSWLYGSREKLTDTLFRAPIWSMKRRPDHLHPVDSTRLPDGTASTYFDRIFSIEEDSDETEAHAFDVSDRHRHR